MARRSWVYWVSKNASKLCPARVRPAAPGAGVGVVGREAARPGSAPVGADGGRARVLPGVAGLAGRVDGPLSVGTRKPDVARAALDAGAGMVNDVSGGGDPRMFGVVRDAGAGMV